MEQGNTATPDELQQAINSITSSGASVDGATDVISQIENKVSGVAPEITPEIAPAAEPVAQTKRMRAQYGDPDLDKVKSMALSDLRPILDKVDITPEKKFMIYKDIIELTEDKACIEPAYNAARMIVDEKTKGEALVFIVECIDKLGIQMTVGGKEE